MIGCLIFGIIVLGCSPEAATFAPAIERIPAHERAALAELVYVPLMRSGRYYPATRRIEIGEWATDRDIWHEWGHALFVGKREGYPAPGATTPYGQTSPDEDVAECYAEILAGTRQCSQNKLDWIEQHRSHP